jgi:uncharacterized protein YuzE
MKVIYDTEVDALYIRLSDEPAEVTPPAAERRSRHQLRSQRAHRGH